MNREERLRQDSAEDGYVLFYSHHEEPYGCLSNFSHHNVVGLNPWTGRLELYSTGEHRYQALKSSNAAGHDWVREARGPGESKDRGRQVDLRPGWGNDYGTLCWYVMFETVLLKAYQHDDVSAALRYSADLHIYEDSPVDDIWGWRYRDDHRGKNLLGRCWMDVREVLS